MEYVLPCPETLMRVDQMDHPNQSHNASGQIIWPPNFENNSRPTKNKNFQNNMSGPGVLPGVDSN